MESFSIANIFNTEAPLVHVQKVKRKQNFVFIPFNPSSKYRV